MRAAALLLLLRLAGLWLALAVPAGAQTLESVLRPGPVIAGHAKWEDDCAACHVRFDRAGQDGRCLDCHKDLGRDMRERRGYHGRLPAQACKTCHTDHKGREARIVTLDEKRFDHRQTDYLLQGRHAPVACSACHRPGRKWSEAPQACEGCHRDDDVHKGSLGAACADCHTEAGWKPTRVDHAKTRFPLLGRHVQAECAACHKSAVYREAPSACVACHRGDDQGARGHSGRFGEQCDSCHDARAWKPSTFRHDRDTRFALKGGHREATCTACHKGQLYRDKAPTACVDCHRQDDRHKGSLGSECAACHTEARWSETGRFDHARTRYPLLGLHQRVECSACHRSGTSSYRVQDTRCVACHRQDDRHRPPLGEACESCHVEKGWKDLARFDHARTRFALRGAHAKPACSACHRDTRYRETPSTCIGCHRADDRHEGQLGTACESCHGENRWTEARFDHAKARFALTGRHLRVDCKACHSTPRYRDAARECVGCHRGEDVHKGRLGARCDSCHNARDWRLWTFDHDRRTSFALDGAHRPLACVRCHAEPAPPGQAVARVGDTCVACHRQDDRHDGAFGNRCEQCHLSSDWKRVKPRAGGTAAGERR